MIGIDNLGGVATAIIALGSAIVVAWKPVRVASRFFKTIAAMARAIHGVPEDPQRPGSGTLGLLTRVDAIGEQGAATAVSVAIIQHEVQHNGGGSIKDAVKRLEVATEAIGERLGVTAKDRAEQAGEIKADIANLSTRLDHHIDNNSK